MKKERYRIQEGKYYTKSFRGGVVVKATNSSINYGYFGGVVVEEGYSGKNIGYKMTGLWCNDFYEIDYQEEPVTSELFPIY